MLGVSLEDDSNVVGRTVSIYAAIGIVCTVLILASLLGARRPQPDAIGMKRLAALATALAVLAAPALAHATPPIQRPNPAIYPVRLDYTNPLPAPERRAREALLARPGA